MTSIIYDVLNQGAQYNNFRFTVMRDIWDAAEKPYLQVNLAPYIGTGFNMASSETELGIIVDAIFGTVDRTLVSDLWAVIGGTDYSTGQDAKLRNDIKAVLTDHSITDPFAFTTLAQMKSVMLTLGMTAESSLSFSDQDMDFSQERAAVFSVAFEGCDITNILQEMLGFTDSDRFSAWFEMRYDSNNNPDASAAARRATAERRYIQSDVFELYNNPASVGYDEAHDVARGYQSNRNTILVYENRYDPDAAGSASNGKASSNVSGDIYNQLQPAIAAVAKHFGVAPGHLEEVLYVSGTSPNLNGDGTAFDSKKNDDDLLIGDGRNNTINGQAGDDAIVGLGGNDRLIGSIGNDRLYGSSGLDLLQGLDGNDRLDGGAGNDRIEGASGNDWLYGNAGNDKLDGSSGNDTLIGGNGDDRLTAGTGNDRIDAGYGNDIAAGGDGNDRLNGLDGKDRLDGGDGNDNLDGGNDNDRLSGGAGADRLDGAGGSDTLIGGDGNDTYILGSDRPEKTSPDPAPGRDPVVDPDTNPNPSLVGGGNADAIVEAINGGIDTVIIGVAGAFDLKNVEKLKFSGDISGNVSVTLNQFDNFTLSNHADTLTLTINKLQKEAIHIVTGAGADTVSIHLAPGIDPSQVLDHKGVTARFDFADLTAQDTIDLTSIGIKKIVTQDLDISQDSGFYLMAPDSQIHLMKNSIETKTYTNDTDSWFVVKCGDDTPYGPEIFGHVTKDNFDI